MNALQPPPDLKTAHWRHMFETAPTQDRGQTSWRQCAAEHGRTPVYAALATAVFAIVLLMVLCPPFVQHRSEQEHDLERGKLQLSRVLGWAAVIFVLALLVPLWT